MAGSVRLQKAAQNADNSIRAFHNALDLAERVLPFYNVESLSVELNGLPTDDTVVTADGQIDKARALDLITMIANLTFYLRDQSSGGNTIIGTAPLNAAGLEALMAKLAI